MTMLDPGRQTFEQACGPAQVTLGHGRVAQFELNSRQHDGDPRSTLGIARA
jgi:hypothetical protein